MIMKWLNFKSTLYTVLALFLFCPEDALAQADKSDEEETKDTVLVSKSEPSKYDKRIHRFRKGWNSLIPTHNKIQFAGNMACSLSEPDGITDGGISGKPTFFWDLFPNMTHIARN